MLSIQDYTKLFGRPATDPDVEAMFRDLGVRRRPALSSPPKSPYEAVLRISGQGILLAFTDRYYRENKPRRLHGTSGDLIFDNIAVTAGIPDVMRRYAGQMPFGLSWDDTRDQARSKMSAHGHGDLLHAYKRDAWWLPDYRVRVTYQPGDMKAPEQPGIFDISMGIGLPPSPPVMGKQRYYPSPDELRALFGQSATSEMFRNAFRSFDPDDLIDSVPREAIDRKRKYGFELYFAPDRRAPDGSHAFVGIDMTRDRLGDSAPWRGQLPYGLSFEDSPAILESRLGRPATQWEDLHTWGYGRWFLKEELVWVQFDNLNNRLESVSLLAPGYRDDLLAPPDDDFET